MGHLANLKRQHREIQDMVNELLSLLNPNILQRNPVSVRTKLSALSGKLSIHLAMEDKYLYPMLIENGRSGVQATAKKFFTEMGDLVDVFQNYSHKWLNPNSIKANSHEFITDSNNIFRTLQQRIERENRELYPLFEGEKVF